MRDKEILGLWEAYKQVHTHQEEVEQLDELRLDTLRSARKKRFKKVDEIESSGGEDAEGRKKLGRTQRAIARKTAPGQPDDPHQGASARLNMEMEYDAFDAILEHLVSEGYAATEEAALAIMANMSEEWRESIVEEVLDERNRGEQGMSDREVTRRRNLGGNVRSRVSASSLGDHGPQSAIQKFHKGKANQRREIHKSGRGTRGDTGESGGQSRYQANKDHSDGYPSITKRGDGPY